MTLAALIQKHKELSITYGSLLEMKKNGLENTNPELASLELMQLEAKIDLLEELISSYINPFLYKNMELQELIMMHKQLCCQMGKVADNVSKEYQYYMLRGKVELLEEFIDKELNKFEIQDDCTYELYDCLGILLDCELKGEWGKSSAINVAFQFMRENKFDQTIFVVKYNGNIKERINLHV